MPATRGEIQLMSASEMDRTLVRLAHEVPKSADLENSLSLAIRRRGVPLAERLARRSSLSRTARFRSNSRYQTVSRRPVDGRPGARCQPDGNRVSDFTGKDIVLTDDVLYTGRTVRAALDALFDHGRPSRVQLLALIDRGHRELPIEARYVGVWWQTNSDEIIEVKSRKSTRPRKSCWLRRLSE